MNLTELFEQQRKLDEEIERKHPAKPREDRLAKKLLALSVELGECANEWRGFKFWSENQMANTHSISPIFGTEEDGTPYQSYKENNPLLEEYIDCLHFALSIGNDVVKEIGKLQTLIQPKRLRDINDQYLWTSHKVNLFYQHHRDAIDKAYSYYYLQLINAIIGLGEMLGFTQQQIEQAYHDKNKTNWERQATGY